MFDPFGSSGNIRHMPDHTYSQIAKANAPAGRMEALVLSKAIMPGT